MAKLHTTVSAGGPLLLLLLLLATTPLAHGIECFNYETQFTLKSTNGTCNTLLLAKSKIYNGTATSSIAWTPVDGTPAGDPALSNDTCTFYAGVCVLLRGRGGWGGGGVLADG